jgi:hypothetical protein
VAGADEFGPVIHTTGHGEIHQVEREADNPKNGNRSTTEPGGQVRLIDP